MTALFDLDSLVYDALYRIVSISEMRDLISKMGVTKARQEVIEIAYNRMEQMIVQVLSEVEAVTTHIDETFYYLTNNIDPIRNRVDPMYKRHRKKNRWANRLRNYIIQEPSFEVKYSLTLEADDMIYDKAKAMRSRGEDFIVISKDKDLKQIEGLYFDYYKEKTGVLDEYFRDIKQYRGLSVISKEDAEYLLARQMLMGDSVDNIKGIPKIGPVKADKILVNKKGYGLFRAVYLTYLSHYHHRFIAKNEFNKTLRLVKIGSSTII